MNKIDLHMQVHPLMYYLYQDLDMWVQNAFSRMTRLAAQICNVPISLITFFDQDQHLLAANFGLDFPYHPHAFTFSAQALHVNRLLVIEDAKASPAVANSPLVKDRPGVRFYAGLPLISFTGEKLGTLNVMDYSARTLTRQQSAALETLGQQVSALLELRYFSHLFRSIAREQSCSRIGCWAIELPHYKILLSKEIYEILELLPGALLTLKEVLSLFPPSSRQTISTMFKRCAEEGQPFEHEAEIHTAKGNPIHVLLIGHAVRDSEANIIRIKGALQDLTEKRKTGINLVQNQQPFRHLADTIPQIIWTAEPDGRIDCANQAFIDYTGMSIGVSSDLHWLNAIHPEDRENVIAIWHQAIRTGEHYSSEHRLRCNNGTYHWHLTKAVPIRDKNGDIIKWYGTSTDFHDRKIAEEKVNRLAHRLTTTLESMTDALFLLDREWRFSYLNPEAERFFQRARGDMLGKLVWDAFPEAAGTAFEQECRRVAHGNTSAVFEQFYPAQGLWLETRIYASNEGLSIYLRDVSETMRSREALRESEERFRNIVKVTADAIWDWDIAANALWWDAGMQSIFGFPLEEVAPDRSSWTGRIHPDDKKRVLESIYRVINSDTNTWSSEYRFQCKSGEYADVLDRGLVIRRDSGEALRMVGGMSDLTSRKKAERDLTRLNRSLQMLSACNKALVRADNEMELLHQICRIAVETGGFSIAWVGYTRNDPHQWIEPMAYADGSHDGSSTMHDIDCWWRNDKRSLLLVKEAIRSSLPVICEDVADGPRFAGTPAVDYWNTFRSLSVLPLRDANETFGVLALYSTDTCSAKSDQTRQLQELADNLAFGIRNIRSQNARRRIETAVMKVAAGVSAATGTEFFEQLALNMAQALGANGSFIARFLPGEPLKARTIAAVVDGQAVENFDYVIKDTPCEHFLEDVRCVVPEHAIERFPNAPGLSSFGAKAYVGWRLDDSTGKPVGLLYVLYREPITHLDFITSTLQIFAARSAAELERQEADARIRYQASLLDKAQDAIIVCGIDQEVLFWNKGAERLYGWTQEEALGKRKKELLGDGPSGDGAIAHVIEHGDWTGEIVQRRKDGSLLTVEAHWTVVKDDHGQPQSILAINTDITQRKAAEHEIQHLAFYDTLTRLPNRRLLLNRLQHSLDTSIRTGHTGALLFIDLDNFKALNDTLGHDTGDLLLQQVAMRLSSCVRKSNTVARLGGDEFVVMLEDLGDNPRDAAAQAGIIGEKILDVFSQSFLLGEYEYHTSPSIGITLFNGQINSIDELLKRADLAMYQAKAAGRNAMRFFDPEMQELVTARLTLETDLRQGLQQKEFLLHYQPQADRYGRMTGTEVLVRWHHPSRGFVSPAEFIPLAEETGLILRLGEWVLETACLQLAAWQLQPKMQGLTMAVNVSARQFRHPNFVQQVLNVVQRTGVNPCRLKLELTESLLVDDMDTIIAKMAALKEKGIGFSLDDFGTGYSSLSYLKRLPLDQLKIDQSFVNDVLVDSNDAAIARTIVALGQSLGLSVIAEGVETEEQRDFLAGHGCDAYQGYLYSRPLPSQQFEAFIHSHH